MPEYDKPKYLKRTDSSSPLDPMVQTQPFVEQRPEGFNKHPVERKKLFGEQGV